MPSQFTLVEAFDGATGPPAAAGEAVAGASAGSARVRHGPAGARPV